MIVQRFNLNLIPKQSPVIVHVNQYDTGAGRLVATLYEGNEPYSPNGTAVIQGTKPDGHGFQYTATLDGNVVTADLTEQMAPVAGDVRTQIVVTESSGVTGTFVFIMRVQPSALPSDADMSESDYPLIEEAIREAQEAVQTAQEATETAQEAVERTQEAIAETAENAENSEAWAQGTRGGIPVEPTDPTYEHNAEYWAQYAERYAQGGLHYKASILFANIPTTGMREGDMYDISDDFTTDSRFEEGAGKEVKGGTNIAWNSDNKWDVLALPPKTTFNGRSGSILPMAGDYDSKKILLSSALHIGGETQSDVQEALEALSDNGVKSFNGRSGSVLPMAGDYSAEQVDYDSNQTVKQKIDALVTKEESDIAGQQSLLKDTVGWTGKNLLKNTATTQTINGVTFTVNSDKSVTVNGTATRDTTFVVNDNFVIPEDDYILSSHETSDGNNIHYSVVKMPGNTVLKEVQSTDEQPFTVNYSGYSYLKFTVWVRSGTTVSNKTAYPMLRKADITDPTYEPYHESVETMYEEEIHGVNLYDIVATSTTDEYGLTWTVNADKSISVSGTPTAFKAFRTYSWHSIPAGDYIISGFENAVNVGINNVILRQGTSNVRELSTGNPKITVLSTDVFDNIYISLKRIDNNTPCSGTIRLMLRKADIEDSTYRPYNHQAIQNQLNAQGVLGAKNLLSNNATSQTINGVTFTVNDDGSITANGTYTGATNALKIADIYDTDFNGCILNGCPSGGGYSNAYRLFYRVTKKSDGTMVNNKSVYDLGSGATITHSIDTSTEYIQVWIQIDSNVTVSNKTFYPMLRLASDPDDTYQPYAMTNGELTEKKINIADLKTVVSASSDFADFKTRIASL